MTSVETHILRFGILFLVYSSLLGVCIFVTLHKKNSIAVIACVLCFIKAIRAGTLALISLLFRAEILGVTEYNRYIINAGVLYDCALVVAILVGLVMCWRLINHNKSIE